MSGRKQISILKRFTWYATLFAATFALFLVGSLWRSYKAWSDHVKLNLEIENVKIERTMNDTFEYVETLMDLINSQISTDPKNLNHVKDVLSIYKSLRKEHRSKISVNMFSWVDDQANLVVNSEFGVLTFPRDLSQRDYIPKTVSEPGVMQLGIPVGAAVSAQWIIPVGIGLLNNASNYVGATVAGINIPMMVSRLERTVDLSKVEFLVFDKEMNVIMKSSNSISTDEKYKNLVRTVEANSMLPERSGLINRPIFGVLDKRFVYYHKMKESPYFILLAYNKELTSAQMTELFEARAIEFVMFGFLVILFLILLRHYIVVPVIKLSDIADQLVEGGRKVEMPKFTTYEIHNLASKLKKIQHYIHEITLTRRKVERKTVQLQRARDEAERAKLAAERANAYKSSFLANVSHELRTPLGAILNFSDMMRVEMFGKINNKYKEYAGDIHKAGKHLLDLIDDILDISKAESGKVELKEEWFDVKENISDCVSVVMPSAKKNDLALDVHFPKENMQFFGDYKRIKQVILNMLSNAIKFTPEGGKVSVNLGLVRSRLTISVADNGVGIAKENIPKVMEEFGQVGDGYSRSDRQGTGLGLPISKRFVELHEGDFKLASAAGKGTTVKISFPARRIRNKNHKVRKAKNGRNTKKTKKT